jgi:hypothetical protein
MSTVLGRVSPTVLAAFDPFTGRELRVRATLDARGQAAALTFTTTAGPVIAPRAPAAAPVAPAARRREPLRARSARHRR